MVLDYSVDAPHTIEGLVKVEKSAADFLSQRILACLLVSKPSKGGVDASSEGSGTKLTPKNIFITINQSRETS